MEVVRILLLAASAAALAACALTPEQKAAREAAQRRYEQNLQVSLAAQCDRETADLMRRQFDMMEQGVQAPKAFRLRYVDKTADPMFQSCYKLAWQNYISQQRLQEMRNRYDYWDDFYGYPFRRHPFWW
ncbi:hypothetical protein [Neisseria chenwenguii]|uniref:Uncharacterized protein n=1 Tax=Neisseria chenwenguii TaxID=1853278 RepID=A0A220S2H2_9NEIS|nr:hypothetical protein [Neisseria chenwenguii]ASK27680.1 hypothetical protein BG910_07970 [Neisseria chenwenguii]ROV55702.1 hypothetical protein EGS38_08380 [Neisseria chenwenguii]